MIENIFRDVARKLHIPYKDLKPILVEENLPMYSLLKPIFRSSLTVRSEIMHVLELLRIPDTSNVPDYFFKSSVDKVLEDFSALTDMEKLDVLQRLGTVTVKVELLESK